MNPFPDGRLDWEYNHLYCDRHIPSRTVDGPAKETVMQAGPASNVKFKQNVQFRQNGRGSLKLQENES